MALRAFLKREVDPVLAVAGWERKRNEFRRIGVDGFTDTLGFVIDNRGLDGLLGFEMQYGIVSPFHREMLTVVADFPAAPTAADPVELLDVASGRIHQTKEVANSVLELSVGLALTAVSRRREAVVRVRAGGPTKFRSIALSVANET